MRSGYSFWHDPGSYVVVLIWAAAFIFLLWHMHKRSQKNAFDDTVIEKNIRRLLTKKDINISVENIGRVRQALKEIDQCRLLLKDDDLNHYEILQRLHANIDLCTDIYRRAGVPEFRITKSVPDSKF